MIKLSEMTYGELTGQVAEAMAEIRRRAYEEGYELGKFDQRMESAFEKISKITDGFEDSRKETPQELRDKIVEQAKEDITELREFITAHNFKGRAYRVLSTQIIIDRGGRSGSDAACDAEFIVNKEKRTVVALMTGVTSGTIYAKGIAKCSPSDCFNVHIGKAIALRRAIGLEVPDGYLNAPQPTEARIGDGVESVLTGRTYIVGREVELDTWERNTHVLEIIDDSREESCKEGGE